MSKNSSISLFREDANGCTQGSLLPRSSYFIDVPKVPFEVKCITTSYELDIFLKVLKNHTWFSFDTETTGTNPRAAELVGMSFCWSEDYAYYIPVQCNKDESCLSLDNVLSKIKSYLQSMDYKKVGQNLKYDYIVLKNYGINLNGIAFDTLIASYLLDAGSRRHNLDLLAKKYLNYKTIHIEELIGKGKSQFSMRDIPLDLISTYAAEDAWVVAKLAPILWAEIEKQHLETLLHYVEIPLITVLADMEYNGIYVDQQKATKIREEFETKILALSQEIKKYTGKDFNPNSSIQLKEQLYTKLDLPVLKLTDKGTASTDAMTLKLLADKHDLPKIISEYRQLEKLKGTYIDSLPKNILTKTNRIHASFNQDVTATGRLSSSSPNLQNIPNRTDDGKLVRGLFSAEPGNVLIAADYSQIELRILAHFSADPRLLEAFASGEDIHAIVASQIAKLPLDQVTPTMRKAAKAINFGIIYGQGPQKLADTLGITKEEAKYFIEQYFKEYPAIKTFKQKVVHECRCNGYVRTITGRRRYLPNINLPDGPDRWSAERMAVNTVIQGSAADLIKIAMLDIFNAIEDQKINAKLLLQIHDELVLETQEDNLHNVCQEVRKIMDSALKISVPILVDIKAGQNWADMKEV